MIKRLVVDAVWRSRQIQLAMLLVVSVLWVTIELGHSSVSRGLTMSLMLSYVLGPVGAIANMGLRELKTLPVRNRDLWMATWFASTVVTSFALTAAQTIAILAVRLATGSSLVPPGILVLAPIYYFAYSGALLPVMPAMGYSLNRVASGRQRWFWISSSCACFAMLIGGFGLPYYIAELLPLTFTQFTLATLSALIGCLALTAFAWKWTPERGGGFAQVRPGASASTVQRKAVHRVDRLTGIPRVAWPFIATWLLLSAITLMGFVAYWKVFESGTWLRTFLRNNALLPFETGFLAQPDGGITWLIPASVAVGILAPWWPFARQLKVLPMTTARLNVLVLVTPFMQWTVIWLTLITLHMAVMRVVPGTLRPDIFVFLGGLGSMGHALMLRYGHKGRVWIAVLAGALTPTASRMAARQWALPVEVLLAAAGLLALGAAAFYNHRTITRSTSSSTMYRQDSMPFGITKPYAPR